MAILWWKKRSAEEHIAAEVKRGMRVLATEHAAIQNLKDAISHIRQALLTRAKRQEVEGIKQIHRDFRRLGKAERRLQPVEGAIEEAMQLFDKEVKAPPATQAEIHQKIEETRQRLRIEAEEILKGTSRYQGLISESLRKLDEELRNDFPNESLVREILDELEHLLNEIDKKWIPALSSDFNTAKKVLDSSQSREREKQTAEELLTDGWPSEAARKFEEAGEPRKVIRAIESILQWSRTEEDQQRLVNAFVRLKDRDRALEATLALRQEIIRAIPTTSQSNQQIIIQIMENLLLPVLKQCGLSEINAWRELQSLLNERPFSQADPAAIAWAQGHIAQLLGQYEKAANLFEAAGDIRLQLVNLKKASPRKKFAEAIRVAEETLKQQEAGVARIHGSRPKSTIS